MPLFVCDECQVVESTATSTFSRQLQARAEGLRQHLLCSECETGVWHDLFPKRSATLEYVKKHVHEFLYTGGLNKETPTLV